MPRPTRSAREVEPPRDVDGTAARLAESLATAERGLAAFCDSLDRSGMREALSGYRELQAVLLNQRLWARSHGRIELDDRFATVGVRAARIHEVLKGYEAVFRPLVALERLEAATESSVSTPAPSPQPIAARTAEQDRVLDLLLREGRLSPRRLAECAALEPDAVARASAALVDEGLVVASGRGGGRSFRLSPRARALTAQALGLVATADEED